MLLPDLLESSSVTAALGAAAVMSGPSTLRWLMLRAVLRAAVVVTAAGDVLAAEGHVARVNGTGVAVVARHPGLAGAGARVAPRRVEHVSTSDPRQSGAGPGKCWAPRAERKAPRASDPRSQTARRGQFGGVASPS